MSGKQSRYEMIIGAVDKFSGTFAKLGKGTKDGSESLTRFSKSIDSFNSRSGFSRVSDAVAGVGGSLRTATAEGRAFFSTLTGMAGKAALVFGGAGGGLFALAKGAANAGDEAIKAAQRAGVGVATWQEYAHAANLADLGTEQLQKGFMKLQEAGRKAASGDKEMSGVFRLAGINPKTAKGELKNADSLFLELADKIQALQDAGKGAEATNLMARLMGAREGQAFIPMLSAGKKGLLELREEAHRLGIVFSEEDGKASEAFNDSLTKLGAAFKGIGFGIGKEALPMLTKLSDKFTDLISGQRGIITGGFKKWLDGLDLESIWASFESGIQKVMDFGSTVNNLVQVFGGWQNVLIGLVALTGGKFLLSIGNLALAFGKLGLAILTTPVGWFLAAVAGIAAAVWVIYDEWDSFVAYFDNLWAGAKAAFEDGWINGIVNVLKNFNPVALILDGMNALIRYFTGLDLKKMMTDKLRDMAASLPEWAQTALFGSAVTDRGDAPPGAISDDTLAGSMDPWGYDGSVMAPSQDLAPAVREISESRTEHVEREEVKITVEAKDNADVTLRRNGGASDSNVSFAQTGRLATANF